MVGPLLAGLKSPEMTAHPSRVTFRDLAIIARYLVILNRSNRTGECDKTLHTFQADSKSVIAPCV